MPATIATPMPSKPSPHTGHGLAVPLLYVALAAIHAGGSPRAMAVAVTYALIAIAHIRERR